MTPEVLTAWLNRNGWRREGPGVFRSTAGCESDSARHLTYAWHPRDGYLAIEIQQVDPCGHHESLTKACVHVHNLIELDTLVASTHRRHLMLGQPDRLLGGTPASPVG